MRWLIVAGFAFAACAHGPSRPEAPPESLLTWADKHPLAARELCTWERNNPQEALRVAQWVRDQPVRALNALQFAATHPGFTPAADPTWHGHVPMRGDLAIAHLLTWATRHPDAAQQIEEPALEWTAEHHGC
jgi:hypothetical protein